MSDSDPGSPAPVRKPGGRPNFNRLKIKKKAPVPESSNPSSATPGASATPTYVLDEDEDDIKFFDRAKEAYHPERSKKAQAKKRASDDEGAGQSKKSRPDVIDLDSGTDDDGGDDSDDDEARIRRRQQQSEFVRKKCAFRRSLAGTKCSRLSADTSRI